MHRCLCIVEIASIIMAYVSMDELLGHATLAALARTCRAFQELALDMLWRHQDNFFNILRCLPRDACRFPGVEEEELQGMPSSGTMVIERRLSPGDWLRFDFYAKRVKSFGNKPVEELAPATLPWGDQEDMFRGSLSMASSVFIELRLRRHSSPLFPSLQTVHWQTLRSDGAHLQYIDLLLGAKLSHLSLYMDGVQWGEGRHGVLSSLCALPMTCPGLQKLELLDCSGLLLSSLTRLLGELPALHNLSVQWTSTHDLENLLSELQRVPRLRTLRLLRKEDMSWSSDSETTVPSAENGPSIGVCTLEIEDVKPKRFGQILRILRPKEARHIGCILRDSSTHFGDEQDVPSTAMLARTLRALEEYCEPSNLESISVTFPCKEHTSQEVISLRCFIQDLEPLLSFHNLVEVNITICALQALDDAALERMALSWPRLQVLNLNDGRWDGPGSSRLTFQSVVYLAQHCPELAGFSLAIDVAATRQGLAVPTGTFPHGKLRWMELGKLILGDNEGELFDFLLNWFPSLKQINNIHKHDGTQEAITRRLVR
ncbi:hypothetical protein OBBRIDRAFT_883311 [Obba rivulosa]|uniref:F-box domain-containing protein n=1 Tax=Obba rivulosa TaxID=1052685 RepID=A0A8E2DUU0_9APHY|nr:hypothetical protein OBBRIDRAFT_883311 [Obba rivulosa]